VGHSSGLHQLIEAKSQQARRGMGIVVGSAQAEAIRAVQDTVADTSRGRERSGSDSSTRRVSAPMGSTRGATGRGPRARLGEPDGTTREWHSRLVPSDARRMPEVDAAIAAVYLSGGNTRRKGGIGKQHTHIQSE